MKNIPKTVSIIIPAKNEEEGLKSILLKLKQAFPSFEIIVVDDGSTDNTASLARSLGATVYSHPYSIGNGGAIKTGARKATGDILIFMDADGQHQIEHILPLLEKFKQGYDMVVGARDASSQASVLRLMGNSFYNFLASKIVGQPIADLTSGCRVVNAEKFKEFLPLLPNGFSSPTTITMAFFRTGYSVAYVPIDVKKRIGKSHLKPFTDGIRFLLIIYKMTVLYSPIKIFLPFAFLHFIAGLGNYAYTYTTQGRFTNMSAVLLSASVIIFLIGLVSEQITTLLYSQKQYNQPAKHPLGKSTYKKVRKLNVKAPKDLRKDH
ncbi:MAG: glycosyltransferase family 2 protein [Proteobacteria bacterium]|nr:glycosyltransferase family 2 protein [Pseudomonadota bacterium]